MDDYGISLAQDISIVRRSAYRGVYSQEPDDKPSDDAASDRRRNS